MQPFGFRAHPYWIRMTAQSGMRNKSSKVPAQPTRARRKRWYWIITISWNDMGQDRMVTSTGTCSPLPTSTREAMFNLLYNRTVKDAGATDAFVLFFSLEPDELG